MELGKRAKKERSESRMSAIRAFRRDVSGFARGPGGAARSRAELMQMSVNISHQLFVIL